MRIGVISNRDLTDVWSSTHYYIYRSLARHGLNPSQMASEMVGRRRWDFARSLLRLGRSKSIRQHDSFVPQLARAVAKEVEQSKCDAYLALHSSTIMPSIQISRPMVYVTDATAALLKNYYPSRTDLSDQDQDWLHECERKTIAKADAIVVPTSWAAQSVLNDYDAAPDRVQVIEWGANLDLLPDGNFERTLDVSRPLQFLFVGLDWNRKGGDIAVETVENLNALGIDSELTIVGCQVPGSHRRSWVRTVRRLDRANEVDGAQLDQLFTTADFYIHPARAECFGHALCEAQAFGLPVVATRTGGISQCVRDDATGLLLEKGTSPAEFARRIVEIVADPQRYSEMSAAAVSEFETRLNWGVWTDRVAKVFQTLTAPLAVSATSAG